MNRDVVDQVRKQEVKGEERGREKEIVHRVKLDAAQGGDDEHQEEEKEERDRSKETDPAGKRTGLKFFRHDHRNFVTRKHICVGPGQIPAVAVLSLSGG